MSRLKTLVGDRTDDEAISIIEDFTDTFDRNGDVSEYEKKITELEAEKSRIESEWRTRYTDRFWNPDTVAPEPDTTDETVVEAQDENVYIADDKIDIDDLFIKKEE